MMRGIVLLVMATVVALCVAPLSAHDEVRIIGAVVKTVTTAPTEQQSVQFHVKMKDGKIVAIALNMKTVITRDKKKVSATELQAGSSVVVDALGDVVVTPRGETYEDVVALEVKIVPAIVSPGKR